MLNLALAYMNKTERAELRAQMEMSLSGRRATWPQVLLLVVVVVGLNLLCLLCVRRHMKRQIKEEMNTQVNEAVNQYF